MRSVAGNPLVFRYSFELARAMTAKSRSRTTCPEPRRRPGPRSKPGTSQPWFQNGRTARTLFPPVSPGLGRLRHQANNTPRPMRMPRPRVIADAATLCLQPPFCARQRAYTRAWNQRHSGRVSRRADTGCTTRANSAALAMPVGYDRCERLSWVRETTFSRHTRALPWRTPRHRVGEPLGDIA